MGKLIKDITIVGGGTAGWMTAAYLNYFLQFGIGRRDGVRIKLIEAPDVPTIGVGEATVPTLRQTLKLLEIDENEFVARTEATFKVGIRFDNWNVDENGKPFNFLHPFGGGLQVHGRNPAASLLAYGGGCGALGPNPTLPEIIGHTTQLLEQRKGPRFIDGKPFAGPEHYAYHLDAGKFAAFLSEVSVARGVEHLRDKVIGVTRNQRGHIASLQLERTGDHPVELVIDCTGFQSLLLGKELEEPFISYSDYLLNDRAIPIQIAHPAKPDFYPATISTARKAGWTWRIPLQGRIGTGYAFSSAFASEQNALDEYLEILADEETITEPRVLPMRVGRMRRSWVGNCVAIGLSSGFLEPLESTAIQFIETSCRHLLQLFPTSDFEEAAIRKFNRLVTEQYEEVRDFVGLHFSLSNREDTEYWKAVRHDAKRSDQLEENLAVWQHHLPDINDHGPARVFSFWSVISLLIGKRIYTQSHASGTDMMPPEAWDHFLQEWSLLKKAAVSKLPDQGELLASMCEAAEIGGTAKRPPKRRSFALGGDQLTMPTNVLLPNR